MNRILVWKAGVLGQSRIFALTGLFVNSCTVRNTIAHGLEPYRQVRYVLRHVGSQPSSVCQRLQWSRAPDFEKLLFALKPPAGLVPGPSAPQASWGMALLEWVESPMG